MSQMPQEIDLVVQRNKITCFISNSYLKNLSLMEKMIHVIFSKEEIFQNKHKRYV